MNEIISIEKNKDNTFAFLFDLDGTLVITDEIYFLVWSEILSKYNIILTKEIFNNYIQGNNDKYVLNTLLKNIEISLNELSNLKDELFIKNIENIKVIDGLYVFLNEIKTLGNKICIVTNCNKKVANKIVEYININKFIDFIISSDDVNNGKPNIEPYKKAIEKYNIKNDKIIIFEDSKSGILSGKGVNPKILIGIETTYDKNELNKLGVDICLNNFNNVNIQNLINYINIDKINYFKNLIKKNSNIFNINDIIIDTNKLKGGFIADVISFQIISNNNYYHQILKYENKEENNLSLMAKKIELYNREYYFYNNIYNNIINNLTICIPKFYNLIYDENNNIIGLVLENLIHKNYINNLNLNNIGIDVSLKIIDRMAKLHCYFWNKDLKTYYPKLKKSNDNCFYPFFIEFIQEKYELFKFKWFKNLNEKQRNKCNEIYNNFEIIQQRFSFGNNLTFIHGDIKSLNIFYDVENNYEPYFIDWQHCSIGKGVQDLIFFIIESFDIINIKSIFYLIKEYYFFKLKEYGINNYTIEEYNNDIYDAICYIPFFTSIWFGTIPQDELIDKNFPYFFISKLFYLLDLI